MNKREQRKADKAAKAAAAELAARLATPEPVKPATDDLSSKVAAAIADMTPEQAAAMLAEKKARLSAAAAKAHATRKANGTSSTSAKAAWATRRAVNQAIADLAAQAS